MPAPARRTSTQIVAARQAEADEFYAGDPPDEGDRGRAARPAPGASRGCCGRSRATSSTSSSGSTATTRTRRRPQSRQHIRNAHWRHLNSMRVLSMPDKWEYPWFAAWDLAFHCVPFALIDPEFAKEQLWLHAVRAVPASQRADSRLRVGVLATSTRPCTRGRCGASTTWTASAPARRDRALLERCFHKLLINFAWWVNKVDSERQQRLRGRLPRPRQHHASSTAARSCRTARCSSSPTPPAGWACSA